MLPRAAVIGLALGRTLFIWSSFMIAWNNVHNTPKSFLNSDAFKMINLGILALTNGYT